MSSSTATVTSAGKDQGSPSSLDGAPDAKLEQLPPPAAPAHTFPDGGGEAWLTVLGAFFALTASFGMLSSFGVFQTYYVFYFHKTPSEVSWIGSLQFFVFFIVGPLVGRVFDAYGPLRLMAGGTLTLTFAMMMTSLCTEYWQAILAQGILVGLGSAMLFFPSLSSIASHFLKRRGLASGLGVTGSSVGGVIFPIALQRLIGEIGFGMSVRVSGFICLALGIAATACVRSRLPRRRPGKWLDVSAFKEPKYAILTIGATIMSFGLFVPYYYIEPFALSQGVSPDLAFYSVAVMNAGSFFGRLLAAPLMDAVGKYNVLIPATGLAGVLCLGLWLPTTVATAPHAVLALVMVFAAAFGCLNGAFMACMAPSIAAISPITSIGVRIGMLYAILAFPMLVCNPIAGAFLSDGGSPATYRHLIIWSGVTQIVGAFIVVGTRVLINPKATAKV